MPLSFFCNPCPVWSLSSVTVLFPWAPVFLTELNWLPIWPIYSFYIINNIKSNIFLLMLLVLTSVVQTFPREIGAQIGHQLQAKTNLTSNKFHPSKA